MLEKLIADAKQAAKDIVDPKKKVDGKAVKRMADPIKRKLDLLNKYVDSLYSILPSAAVTDDDGGYSVTALNNVLEGCLDQAKTGNEELLGFLEAIENWELHQKKDPEGKKGVTGGTDNETKPPEIKGVATSLKPEELTSSIAAHDMSLWVEQWNEYKENSVFSRHGEDSIIAYLKTCVSRDILNAIDYKTLKTEKAMFAAIQLYLDM